MAENRNPGNTLVAGAGLSLLTVNSGLAIYRARGDPASILFVSGSYAALLLLFACLVTVGFTWKVAAVMPSASAVLSAAAVWGMAIATAGGGFVALTTLLTVGFAWKVASVMPSTVLPAAAVMPSASAVLSAAAVWGMAIATAGGGFVALTTLLTVGFAWKVAAVMPSTVLPAAAVMPPASAVLSAAAVSGMAIATAGGGFVALTTLLTVGFTWKVAAVMPSTVLPAAAVMPSASAVLSAAAVWGMAIATAGGGFVALTTLLTVGFAWKVAAVMPSTVLPAAAVMPLASAVLSAAAVWGMAIATAAGGFVALTTQLTVGFAWKVAAVMPSTVLPAAAVMPLASAVLSAAAVWGMAIATAAGCIVALTTQLTVGFAWKVAAVMPSTVLPAAAVMPSASAVLPAAAVWGLATATTAGGFFAVLLFVTVSCLARVLLFACLRAYGRAPPGLPARRAAVWPLTAPRAGRGRSVSVAALVMAALGVMTCETALAVHDALGDLCPATLVLVGVAYAAYLALTFRFVRAFAGRDRAVEHGQVQGPGVGAVN